ncbi:lipopolysaccharide biosynthesis protein [Agarivorans sp. B2Z047]|uniref:lipopolysaccharide biosynthesis protein n=1 Tax=Agarivorans sp. B2Z047 TaxID=2652721 RepID=UPI00128C8974|nr:lipopolysaccharide biosynthesis protein [Agarivorans sp. B2Z047]MPW28748.1 lipopolysaccharide biosynthesis protein [Agarivorans sp. B2Z047]UQN41309.1 lipopolysaccharide biosynthesis protein [Agarivorans sp. B2Z047]
MSNKVEERYVEFKLKCSTSQWNNPQYLLHSALELEVKNLPLSFRIIQRAKTLKSDGDEINRVYSDLRLKMRKSYPHMLKPKLSEKTTVLKSVDNSSSHQEIAKTEVKSNLKLNTNLESLENINTEKFKGLNNVMLGIIKMPICIFVILPWMVFAFYQVFYATPKYESQMQLIVQQPDSAATMDASMAILSGLGVSSSNSDPQLVRAYIYSNDMLKYLERELSLKSHFTQSNIDVFSRLSGDSSKEDYFDFYLQQVRVEIDDVSQIVSVYVKAFDPEFAFYLSQAIAKRAEWYINSIGHELAKAQLKFIEGEHQLVESRLQLAKKQLLEFQQQYNLLDPEAEGMALSQIAFAIESQIATMHAELRALKSTMSEKAPQVVMAQAKLDALYQQLEIERERLTEQGSSEHISDNSEGLSVSQLLARFSEYKVNLELALAAYTSSQISLEKSRIEAYRQLKYLVRVETPTKPEDNKYPEVIYNLALMAAILLLLFGSGKIIYATIKELN